MRYIIILAVFIVAILVLEVYSYRKEVIKKKLKGRDPKISEVEEKELMILAQICWDRAKQEGVRLPSNNALVLRLDDDPYTWIILKLGIRDREIYRTRMSIEDISSAREEAEKEIKKGET